MTKALARRLILAALVAPALLVPISSPARPTARAARGCAEVYWRSLRNGDQRCPYTHSILSDLYWRLHWHSWNSSTAYGIGVWVSRNAICNPQGQGCRDQRGPLRVRLTRPRNCPDGRTIFTRISIIAFDVGPDGRRVNSRSQWSYACIPRDGTGDGIAGG